MVASYLVWPSRRSSAVPSCSCFAAHRFPCLADSSNRREVAPVESQPLRALRARVSVPPAWELWHLLDELHTLLTGVTLDVYCARFATDVSGSIGEHIRHCLDHVSALLGADASTTLSYDCRERGTAVETDPTEAAQQILRL